MEVTPRGAGELGVGLERLRGGAARDPEGRDSCVFRLDVTDRRQASRITEEGGVGHEPPHRRCADPEIEVELLRLSGYRSLTTLLRTGHPGPESSLEKIMGSETDQRLQDLALSLVGPYGALRSGPLALGDGSVARQFLYARSETIMGGTSEIQRNVIAQRILGLPR